MTADQIDERGLCSTIWHMQHLRAGGLVEHHASQMRRRAVSLRCVVEFARIGFGVGDEFGHWLCREIVAHRQCIWDRRHDCYWNECGWIIRKLLEQQWAHGDRRRLRGE